MLNGVHNAGQQLGDDMVAETYFMEEYAADRDSLPGNGAYPSENRLTYCMLLLDPKQG
jgi:hypothetical protein